MIPAANLRQNPANSNVDPLSFSLKVTFEN